MDPQNLYTSGITNLLIALTSVITAVGIVIVNIIVAKAKARVDQTSDIVIRETKEIGETTKTTLGHVNSAATEMRAQIEALRHDNEQLKMLLNENKQIAAVLAATQAALAMPGGSVGKVQQSGERELKAIEKNTEATARALEGDK